VETWIYRKVSDGTIDLNVRVQRAWNTKISFVEEAVMVIAVLPSSG
jgi:predicted secreted protein